MLSRLTFWDSYKESKVPFKGSFKRGPIRDLSGYYRVLGPIIL